MSRLLWTMADPEAFRQPRGVWRAREAVIGVVRLADVLTDSPSPWAKVGWYHWVFEFPWPVDPAIPCHSLPGTSGPVGPARGRGGETGLGCLTGFHGWQMTRTVGTSPTFHGYVPVDIGGEDRDDRGDVARGECLIAAAQIAAAQEDCAGVPGTVCAVRSQCLDGGYGAGGDRQ